MAVVSSLPRGLPLHRARPPYAALSHPSSSFARPPKARVPAAPPVTKSPPTFRVPPSPSPSPPPWISNAWLDQPDYRQWKDNEEVIFKDIENIMFLTKNILHSDRYLDGERLSDQDEKAVVEKLLPYHPHSEDKIGCGLDSIMVDRHPQFKNSRCLFVVRTDGGWIDFSYQKCLRAYIRDKYPCYGERFVREHFRRG